MARKNRPSLALRQEEAWIAAPEVRHDPPSTTMAYRRAFLDRSNSSVTSNPNAPLRGDGGCTVNALDFRRFRSPANNSLGG